MAKTKVSDYSSTAASNTDISGINLAEGMMPSDVNNAIRELMAQLKNMQAGLDGSDFTVGGNLYITGTPSFSSLNVTGNSVLGTGYANTVTLNASTLIAPNAISMANKQTFSRTNFNGVVSISGTTMTVTTATSGALYIGSVIDGTGVTAGTTVTAFGSGSGGLGTYTVSTSSSVAGVTVTGTTSDATLVINANDAIQLPVGSTTQRPNGGVGLFRYNSTLNAFEGYGSTGWGSIGGGGGASGGGTDKVFYENDQVITTNYTVTAGKNAMSTGAITVNSGVTVTVPSGSRWVVL